jgi:4-hydroxyphenylacetate 3-monooxygenase
LHVSAAGLRAPGGQTRLYHRPAQRSLECTGTLEFRGVQADLGEVVAWRNMFWALSDSMCSEATPWVNGAYLPDHAALQTYRVMAPMAYAKIKNIIERNVTSGLIYLPSSARDLNNPQIDQYLAKYVRGSTAWITLNVSRSSN